MNVLHTPDIFNA